MSDAYIAGMSAKRRKIIQNSKPTDVRSLLEDSVRRAIDTVAVSPTTQTTAATTTASAGGDDTSEAAIATETPITADDVTASIATDATVQTQCSEYVRNKLRERIRRDSEYTAEKHPLTKKFLNN